MFVLEDIININKVLYDYFKEDIISLFLDGYCLDYYYILKEFYPESVLVLEKGKDHCASLINGNIYDVSGIRNINDFIIPSKIEEDFVYDFYKKMDNYDYKKIIKQLNEKKFNICYNYKR